MARKCTSLTPDLTIRSAVISVRAGGSRGGGGSGGIRQVRGPQAHFAVLCKALVPSAPVPVPVGAGRSRPRQRLIPQNEPYRAWATFSFTARSGRVNECDLFMATPGGLYLVELKGHPGRVINNGVTWRFHGPDRVRTLHNPLNLTDLKSKELKSQLEWAVGQLPALRGVQVPRIQPAVFLTDPGLISELDDIQKINVYGREGAATGLKQIWTDLLGRAPQRESQRITPRFSQLLPQLMTRIGISQSQTHLEFGDGWKLESRPLDAGPTWEDRLARRDDIVREEGRVRA